MRIPLDFLSLTLSILPCTFAVFADEAYQTDYHHELLGLPQTQTTFFHRPRKDDKATLLYTLSDLGVLGAVHPGTGKLVWRQILDGNETVEGFLRPVGEESIVVSGRGTTVEAWDAMSGLSRWKCDLSGIVKDVETIEEISGKDMDILVLSEEEGKPVVMKFKGETGQLVWMHKDTNADIALQVSHNIEDVFLVSLAGARGGYNIRVTSMDPETGRKRSEYLLTAKTDVYTPEDVLYVGPNPGMPFIAWTDQAKQNLKINILAKSGSVQKILPLRQYDQGIEKVEVYAPDQKQSLPHFLVHTHSAHANRADIYHIDLIHGDINHAYELPKLSGKGAVSLSTQAANVYFTRITQDEVIIVSSATHGVLGRWPLKVEKDHGTFMHGASEVVHRSGDAYAVRTSLVTSNDDWVMIRNGAEAWTRIEGLSGTIAAQWADIPTPASLVKTLEAEAHINPLSAYIHRVRRHLNDLKYLPAYLSKLPESLLKSIIPSSNTAQAADVFENIKFGFNKIVILATVRGRIYGLDAGNHGAVVWTVKPLEFHDKKKWDVKGIFVDSDKDTATIYGARGEYVTFQVTTGKVIEKMDGGSKPAVQSTAVVQGPAGAWLLPVGLDGSVEDISVESAPTSVLVVQGADGSVKGLRFGSQRNMASSFTAWTFHPGHDERIVGLTSRPAYDPVASIGRVLGDRNVLYKYLNPNVALLTAVSDDAATATFYLLDTVSGEVLYSTSHGGVDTKQSITSALTENWFAYSLWSDLIPSASTTALPSSKGYQLVIAELYESQYRNDRGPLGTNANSSSIEPSDSPNAEPALPHVITQSFVVPESISHMAVTQTRQGITTRQLLCTLAGSNTIVGVPRHLLDPRRPVGRDPSAQEQEEGLLRYQPFIDFDPKLTLTHKREVAGIENVITTPALLESTSLIFAYGLDIFGTRITPSAAFDILGKGFNKLSLIATVVALAIGVGVLAPMVRRKQIDGKWIVA